MKRGGSCWLLPACLIPPAAVLAALTEGFRQEKMTPGALLLAAAVLLGLLLLVWHRRVERPTRDFLAAINRAIGGDYRVRFSPGAKSGGFLALSRAFNRLMRHVERQTEQLTESRRRQRRLYEDEKIYRSALELTCERVFEADLTYNRLVYGHETYRKFFPFFHTERYDDMIRSIAEHAVDEGDAEKYRSTFLRRNLLGAFHGSRTPEIDLEYRQKLPDGGLLWVRATVILIGGYENGSVKAIGYVKDIDARKKQEIEMLRQSQKDGLTGLYNKKATQLTIEEYLSGDGKAGRHAAIMVDIDDFKRINDTFGHPQGDAALVRVAQGLASLFRSSDVVGRIGGDEFFILMHDYASIGTLLGRLEDVRGLFRKIRLEGASFRIGGSIGAALYPEDGTSYRELFKKADLALYCAKAHGKNRFCLYGRNAQRSEEPPAPPEEAATLPAEKPGT